jgi:hypothetical protein
MAQGFAHLGKAAALRVRPGWKGLLGAGSRGFSAEAEAIVEARNSRFLLSRCSSVGMTRYL